MIRDKQLKVESPKQLEKMLKDKNSAKKIYEFLGNLYSIYELDYKEDMEHLLSEEDRLNNGSQAEKVKEIQKQQQQQKRKKKRKKKRNLELAPHFCEDKLKVTCMK